MTDGKPDPRLMQSLSSLQRRSVCRRLPDRRKYRGAWPRRARIDGCVGAELAKSAAATMQTLDSARAMKAI
jgi:hypothetical protein